MKFGDIVGTSAVLSISRNAMVIGNVTTYWTVTEKMKWGTHGINCVFGDVEYNFGYDSQQKLCDIGDVC